MNKTKEKFIPNGVTGIGTENDLFYREFLSGPDGMHFELFKDSKNTHKDVLMAKKWLRASRDVCSIRVVTFATHAIYQR